MISRRSADSLHVAVVAPPWFQVPPSGYGGVESVCGDLVDGLVARGHEVTLIGAGEPGTRATRYVSTYDEPPSHRLGEPLPEVLHVARAAEILARLDVDVVHDHTLAGPLLARGRRVPTVVTVHGPVTGEPGRYYRALERTADLVSISANQRRSAPDLPWVGTVYNAVDVATFPYCDQKEDFLLFLGRLHPDKAAHVAIDAARGAGLPIVVAGKCTEKVETDYVRAQIQPRMGPDVTIFGCADATQKRDLLSRAAALIFPIQWEEPFGMVMIEAMACGTPVVTLRRGAAPEVVVDGVTGVICDNPDQLATAAGTARSLSSAACREHVSRTFNVPTMVAGYEAAYRTSIAARRPPRPATTLVRSTPLVPGAKRVEAN
jgi:glycosyltransferase involved in cell wall biosynthesis